MEKAYDAIVVGLGAMGSVTLYQLAKFGKNVLGMEQFDPPHTMGSSHGDTRITRQAIGEGAQYTPLSLRSYELFREIEKLTGKSLLTVTGGLIISSEGPVGANHVPGFFANTVEVAKQYGIKHEMLTAAEIRRRFPHFNVCDNERGYFEYEAGYLRPEECIRAQLALAKQFGAKIHTNEKMQGFDATGSGVTVRTDRGSYQCEKLVLSAGPWIVDRVDSELRALFKVHRQVLYWFDVEKRYEDFAQSPVFIWEPPGKPQGIYGFPAIDGVDGGFKIATGTYETSTHPDKVVREVSEEESTEMFNTYVKPLFPDAGRKIIKSSVCMYTVTGDAGFVIDKHPMTDRVIVCSPCSGHGFKHSAAIGESVAQLVVAGTSSIDLSEFTFEKRPRETVSTH